MSMAAATAVEISNTAIALCAGVPLVTFLVASAGVFFKPELRRLMAWLRYDVPRHARRLRRWVRNVRRDVRIKTLEWLTFHRFNSVAAYLGLSPRELGIL